MEIWLRDVSFLKDILTTFNLIQFTSTSSIIIILANYLQWLTVSHMIRRLELNQMLPDYHARLKHTAVVNIFSYTARKTKLSAKNSWRTMKFIASFICWPLLDQSFSLPLYCLCANIVCFLCAIIYFFVLRQQIRSKTMSDPCVFCCCCSVKNVLCFVLNILLYGFMLCIFDCSNSLIW